MEKKFRAWDDCTKQMVYFNFEDLCRHNEKPFEHTVDGVNASYPLEYDGLWLKPIMQSTRLFDKTGKEIYERDILRWSDRPDHRPDFIIIVAEIDYGWEEEWVHGGKVEIIGNIYKNLDLC